MEKLKKNMKEIDKVPKLKVVRLISMLYATAYVVLNGHRYTGAQIRVRAEMTHVEVLKQLMALLKKLKIKVSLLLTSQGVL